MLTEKDYCDYDTCVALKELGYDGYCAAYYHLFDDEDDARNSFEYAYGFDFQNSNNIYRVGAPLLYQAQKWLRKEKEVYVSVTPEYNEFGPVKGVKYRLEVAHWKDDEFGYETIEWLDDNYTIDCFDSYEEALSEGIKEAVKLLKEK